MSRRADPTRIDVDVVDARLRELSRRIARASAKRPSSVEALARDEDLQDIVTRNLELAVQAAIDVAMHVCAAHGVAPATSGDAFTELGRLGVLAARQVPRLRRCVGFRNVLVHDYVVVDWAIVMRVLDDGVADLAAFGRAMVRMLDAAERSR